MTDERCRYRRAVQQFTDVSITWFEDWYDGPTTGVAEHAGTRYWFTPLGDNWFDRRPRRYVLHSLLDADADGLDERIRDSKALSADDYWSKYHPDSESRNVAGFEPYDGELIGWFEATESGDEG